MAVTGRKPKAPGTAVNHHKPTHEWVEVENVPYTDAPPLPEHPGAPEDDWHPMTRAWWADVSSMPHAFLWQRSDWRFAFDTALTADRFYGGIMAAATELRNREKVLGTTADYRRDLRIRYVETTAEERPDDSEVPSNVSYLDL